MRPLRKTEDSKRKKKVSFKPLQGKKPGRVRVRDWNKGIKPRTTSKSKTLPSDSGKGQPTCDSNPGKNSGMKSPIFHRKKIVLK